MTDATALLSAADAVLAGPHADRNRVACWHTRTAMETAVDELLTARGLHPGRASMRSKLTCLHAACADSPGLATRVDYAWCRLSEACHQHAYELSPTYAEAAHLAQAGCRTSHHAPRVPSIRLRRDH